MKAIIPYELHQKIKYFVDKSPIEISMMARVKIEKNEFTLTNVYLLDQENTATSTDIDSEALGKLMYETREDEGLLNCWIHSHVNMGVLWSSIDRSTMEEFGKNGFLLSLVFNKKGEVNCSYYQGATENRPHLVVDDIPVTILHHVPLELADWEKEFKDKCRVPAKKVYAEGYSGVGKCPTRMNSGNTKNGGKIGLVTTTVTKRSTTSRLPKKKDREIGMINPANHLERWHVSTHCPKGKWVSYNLFCRLNDWYDSVNLLDAVEGQRTGWISLYFRDKGEMPLDDYAVNDYYMDTNEITAMDFYYEVDDLDIEGNIK
jgi:hypothetical protein